MRALPPLDLHAHIDPDIDPKDLEDLRSVIFAVTRSLAEAEQVLERTDLSTVWGVGCHPGVVDSQRAFSPEEFSKLLDSTAFAGELGLDGKSPVPLIEQRKLLHSVLGVLAKKPRVVSLHSYAATDALIDELEALPIKGVILHWWLGDESLTRRAVRLGCYFSVNASSVRNQITAAIPTDRLLTETDHPFGDRLSKSERAPGRIEDVERSLSHLHRLSTSDIRLTIWRNLGQLIRDTECSELLPQKIRAWLAVVA